jgi:hypothetical protein
MSFVRASALPTSTSAGELRQLFAQIGELGQLVLIFEAGAAEGQALVAYKSAEAAAEAADLLDGYPLGTSLLEVKVNLLDSALPCHRRRHRHGPNQHISYVLSCLFPSLLLQPVAADQFVGQLVSRLMARSDAWGRQAPAPPPPQEALPSAAAATAAAAASAAGASGREAPQPAAVGSNGGSGMTALEEEMLQLQLRGQADDIQQLGVEAAAAAGQAFEARHHQQQEEYYERQRQKRQQWQQWQQHLYAGGEEGGGEDEGWQDVRGSSGARHTRGAGAQAGPPPGGGGSGSGGQAIPPNTGLWLGWIDMHVDAAQLAQALTRCAQACAPAWHVRRLASCLACWQPGLLAGWLAGWLAGQPGCLPNEPTCSPTGAGLTGRPPPGQPSLLALLPCLPASPACLRRFGPVHIEHLQPANATAYDGKRYKVRLHCSPLHCSALLCNVVSSSCSPLRFFVIPPLPAWIANDAAHPLQRSCRPLPRCQAIC